jgi:hypothetical protein
MLSMLVPRKEKRPEELPPPSFLVGGDLGVSERGSVLSRNL